MTNPYTEHATMTTKFDNEVERNRTLMIIIKVLVLIVLIQFFSFVFKIGLAIRSDRFFRSECVVYPKLPIPVPTPSK